MEPLLTLGNSVLCTVHLHAPDDAAPSIHWHLLTPIASACELLLAPDSLSIHKSRGSFVTGVLRTQRARLIHRPTVVIAAVSSIYVFSIVYIYPSADAAPSYYWLRLTPYRPSIRFIYLSTDPPKLKASRSTPGSVCQQKRASSERERERERAGEREGIERIEGEREGDGRETGEKERDKRQNNRSRQRNPYTQKHKPKNFKKQSPKQKTQNTKHKAKNKNSKTRPKSPDPPNTEPKPKRQLPKQVHEAEEHPAERLDTTRTRLFKNFN